MPLPHAAGCIKVRTSGVIGDGEFGMIHHYFQGTGFDITDADAAAFAADCSTAWGDHIKALYSPEVVLKQIDVDGLNSGTDGVGSWAGSIAGTTSAEAAAAQECVLVKDVIALRYRGGHPRHYWPGPDDDKLNSTTTLTPAAISAFNAALNSWEADISAAGVALWGSVFYRCMVSYYTGHALRPTPLSPKVFGFTTETKLATQRRRVGR